MPRDCAEAWQKKYGIGDIAETLAARRSDWYVTLPISAKQATEFTKKHGQPGQTFSQAILHTARQIVGKRKVSVAYVPRGTGRHHFLPPHDILMFFEKG